MSQSFKGPLGLWSFPILNFILQMMQGQRTSAIRPVAGRIRNEEKWNWTDYKGRPREFIIHREVTEE